PVITANKACVSRLAVPKTFNGEIRAKHAKGWIVGGATQWENDERGVLETEVFEAGCYLTDECLSRITTSERYPNHLPNSSPSMVEFEYETPRIASLGVSPFLLPSRMLSSKE
ncbi:hypothetical protein KUCAC02_012379, partial [Chaenocephalus aceratus]